MNFSCKFCEEKIEMDNPSIFNRDWVCDNCNQYSIVFLPNYVIYKKLRLF